MDSPLLSLSCSPLLAVASVAMSAAKPKAKIYGQPPPLKDIGVGSGSVSAMRLALAKQGFMGTKPDGEPLTPLTPATPGTPFRKDRK